MGLGRSALGRINCLFAPFLCRRSFAMSILLLAALLAVLLCVYSDSDDVRPAAPQIPGAEVLTAVDVEPDVRLRGVCLRVWFCT